MRRKVNVLERNGKKYYYTDFGYEAHGKSSFRLWIAESLIEFADTGEREDLYVEIEGLRDIKITEKGNFVLIPSENTYVFNIGWASGYRGNSYYTIAEPEKVKVEIPYSEYRSPRGNLGISNYALVVSNSPSLKVHLSRTGRTYGAPEEMTVEYVYENGRVISREIHDDPELENLVSTSPKPSKSFTPKP